MRGFTAQLRRACPRRPSTLLSCARIAPTETSLSLSNPSVRAISSSPSSHASLVSLTTSASESQVPIVPFDKQTVHATIHHFPSLEPLRLETYPANHLYLPTRRDILHRAVVFEGDASRLGTASTRWRDEIRGSARKIRPQKGSGRARLGDKKSPMLKGGGVAFGPKPRDFSTELQKKVYDLAFRTALSYRFRKGELVIVDNALEIESPFTELLAMIFSLNGWGNAQGRSLMVTGKERPLLEMTLAQKPRLGEALVWNEVDVKDLLQYGRIVIEKSALRNILQTHQNDLVQQRNSPRTVPSLAPSNLLQVPGWAEFRDLEVAALEQDQDQQLALKGKLYREVADKRWEKAKQMSGDEALRLKISALELRREGFKAQAELVTEHLTLQQEVADKEKEAELKDVEGPEFTQLSRDATFLGAKALHYRAMKMEWEAQAALTQAGAVELDGDEAGAFSWREHAESLYADIDDLYTDIIERLTGANMQGASEEEAENFRGLRRLIGKSKKALALRQGASAVEDDEVI